MRVTVDVHRRDLVEVTLKPSWRERRRGLREQWGFVALRGGLWRWDDAHSVRSEVVDDVVRAAIEQAVRP